MSRLRTDTRTHGNVKVEQYSAEAESAKLKIILYIIYVQVKKLKRSKSVSYISLTSAEVSTAGFQLKLVRRWTKYIFLYFLPAGKICKKERFNTIVCQVPLLLFLP